ncbi:MAG: hypothetical protein ACLRWF_09645 [Ruthenibacterium sp.]
MERGAEATAPKREKTARFRETIFSPLALGHGVGEVLYYIGFETEYTLLRFARACKRAVLWVFYGVLLVVRTLGSFAAGFLRAVGEDLAAPWRQLRQGLHNLRTMLRAERAEAPWPQGRPMWCAACALTATLCIMRSLTFCPLRRCWCWW